MRNYLGYLLQENAVIDAHEFQTRSGYDVPSYEKTTVSGKNIFYEDIYYDNQPDSYLVTNRITQYLTSRTSNPNLRYLPLYAYAPYENTEDVYDGPVFDHISFFYHLNESKLQALQTSEEYTSLVSSFSTICFDLSDKYTAVRDGIYYLLSSTSIPYGDNHKSYSKIVLLDAPQSTTYQTGTLIHTHDVEVYWYSGSSAVNEFMIELSTLFDFGITTNNYISGITVPYNTSTIKRMLDVQNYAFSKLETIETDPFLQYTTVEEILGCI